MTNGFILLSRDLLESDVFASQKLLKIWIWCLLKANYKDRTIPLKIGKGERLVKVKRGSFLFGRMKAEDELFIDGSTIYKLMKKLSELDMISIKSNNQYSIVTVCKYNTYQNVNNYQVATKEQQSNNQVTSEEQQSNTTKKVNKDKKDNKDKLHLFKNSIYFDFEVLKKEIDSKYYIYDLKYYHQNMIDYSESKGAKYINWLATCRNWINRDVKENKAKVVNNNSKMVY